MATGGIFTLITNDGKQDRMLMATQLLNTRLVEIRKMRARAGLRDPTPTLVDIERTHLLFMNAHFKPFAAIGFEYNKVRPQSGTVGFGNTGVQFSIPQFGDFFHDMVLHLKITQGVSSSRWQWANFLGERLVKRAKFEVNGNPLDEYNDNVHKFHESFFVTPNKRTGWNRMIGQEQCENGFLEHVTAAQNGSNGCSPVRECKLFANGLQTPKTTHNAFELFIPLLFWFNKDPRLSIPSVSIPYGQRFITIDFATLNEVARLSRAAATCADNGGTVTFTTTPAIDQAILIINNIFVNPEVHDIFIKRIGFNLIRVHRLQTVRVNTSGNQEILLNQLKWPVETLYVGLRPVSNNDLTASPNNVMENWHIFGGVTDDGAVEMPVLSAAGGALGAGNAISAVGDLLVHNACFKCCYPTINEINIEAHGVPLGPLLPNTFYNAYVPYTYGGHHINTPDDCGALMINFNLYPGSYQPSGHVNVSRAREFFIKFSIANIPTTTTAAVSSSTPADLIIVAVAINFLLISDGSAVLRYST